MKSNLVTREGYEALKAELDQLWRIERPQVTQAVHEAAKNGDRSENGDYIYGKRRLREIYRTGKNRFPVGYDYLLHATPAAADLDYAGLEHRVRKLTERLRDAVGCN